jgi:hypothetical protein
MWYLLLRRSIMAKKRKENTSETLGQWSRRWFLAVTFTTIGAIWATLVDTFVRPFVSRLAPADPPLKEGTMLTERLDITVIRAKVINQN